MVDIYLISLIYNDNIGLLFVFLTDIILQIDLQKRVMFIVLGLF